MSRSVRVSVLAALLLAGCGNGAKAPAVEDSGYKVLSDQHYSTVKRSVDVMLDQRLDKADLRKIATALKNRDQHPYDKTVIGFYIAAEDQSGGYWATATYDPDLTLRILGIPLSRIVAVRKALAAAGQAGAQKTLRGAWLDDRPDVRAILELLKQPDGLVLKSVNAEGDTVLTPMVEINAGGQTRLRDPHNPDANRYLLINGNGQLEFWDASGRYYIASSL